MLNKKILAASIISLFAVSTANGAYTEVACSTDEAFNENSCNQCFIGENKAIGSNIGFLSDKWINTGTESMLMYSAENLGAGGEPKMIALNGSQWIQVPEADNFWEETPELKAKYSEELSGYLLKPGETVTWLESATGYAYSLVSTNAANNENAGLLVYPIVTHKVEGIDNILPDAIEHRECVLFKASNEDIPTPPEEPKGPEPKLPQTGPEHILLLLFAMMVGIAVFKFTRKES